MQTTTTSQEGEKKERKKSKRIYRTSQKITLINAFFFFFWVTAVRVLSLAGSHSPPYITRMPSNTVLISGPVVGAAQILIWSYSSVFLPSMSTAIRASVFSFVGALNGLLYIPYTQNLLSWLCGFNLQLVQKVGRFCVFFLSHTGPGFQLWFHCRLCMSIVHWGFLLRLPRRAWVCPNKGLGLPLAGVEVV